MTANWKFASRKAALPSAIHFLVCPHSPESGILLNKSGVPVLTDFSSVDWAGLAASARAAIDGLVPKSVKVYVADDAIDVLDLLGVSTETGLPFEGIEGFDPRLRKVLSRLKMQEMRAGITKLAGRHPDLHANPPIRGKRPPLGAMVITLKFTNGLQLIDYVSEATETLFGYPAQIGCFEGLVPRPTTGVMPPFFVDWLNSQFGVVYGADCTAVVIAQTYTDHTSIRDFTA